MKFNPIEALQQAWNELWEEKAALRTTPSHYRSSEGFYITRQELIRKVRAYAYADLKGKPRKGANYDYGVRLTFNLDGVVCDWLSRQESVRAIEGHTFGRHMITGRRYRPYGEPLSPVELATMEAKAKRASKPRPLHAYRDDSSYRALCAPVSKRAYGRDRSSARMTSDHARVTCPRCLKLMNERTAQDSGGAASSIRAEG